MYTCVFSKPKQCNTSNCLESCLHGILRYSHFAGLIWLKQTLVQFLWHHSSPKILQSEPLAVHQVGECWSTSKQTHTTQARDTQTKTGVTSQIKPAQVSAISQMELKLVNTITRAAKLKTLFLLWQTLSSVLHRFSCKIYIRNLSINLFTCLLDDFVLWVFIN